MSLELIYTSVPRGLSPGSSGFCTAAATGGMSRQIVAKLESLSGYQFHFNLSDPRAAENPVNWAHTQVRIGAETLSVLSRIAYSGADYSSRTNKIAHHFLLEHGEQLANGPAWMLMAMAENKVLVAAYGGEPRSLPKRDLRTLLPADARPPEPATTWQSQTGDAGWAGVLAKAFRENPKVPAFVIFAPGQELLPLFEESLALLPPEERWEVGFATYYTALPAGCQYHWRGIIAGSSAAKEIQRFPNATVLDLTTALGHAPDNMFTQAARTGAVLPPVRAPERPKIKIVERAPQPVSLAAEIAAEANDLALAMESERHGPAVDPRELVPSPAQLRALTGRARRARWVWPLVAAVIVLALSNAALLDRYVLHSGAMKEKPQSPVQPLDEPSKTNEDSKAPKAAAGRGDAYESPCPNQLPAETGSPVGDAAPGKVPSSQKADAGGTPAQSDPPRKTGDTQAVRAPPVSLPELEKGWANRQVLPKERRQAQVTERKEGEIRFAVGTAAQFIKPPIMDERFGISPDPPVGSVTTIKVRLFNEVPWRQVTCSFEDSGGSRTLVWRFDPQEWKDAQAELDHLAIEVLDKTQQCVWLCEFKSPQPEPLVLDLGLGKQTPDVEVAMVPIAHPWPKTLRLRYKQGAESNELSSDASIQAPSGPNVPKSSILIKYSLNIKMMQIVAELNGLKMALNESSERKREIGELKTNLSVAKQERDRKNDLEDKRDKSPAEMKDLNNLRKNSLTTEAKIGRLSGLLSEKEKVPDQVPRLIADASKAFADCQLEVRDSHDRTVAIIRFKF